MSDREPHPPRSEDIRIAAFSTMNIPIISPDDLIKLASDSIDRTSLHDPERPAMLFRLSGMLDDKFRHTRNPDDLDRVKTLEHQALSAAEVYNTKLVPVMQSRLAVRLTMRFQASNDPLELDEGIIHAEQAVDMTPAEDDRQAHRMRTWANILRMRYNRTLDRQDINKAIDILRLVVKIAREDDQQRADYICHLGTCLISRYDKHGSEEDLKHAIEWTEKAVLVEGGEKVSHWDTLGSMLEARYNLHNDMEDLNGSITLSMRTVAAISTTTSPPDRARYKMNLASKLYLLYKRNGDLPVLDDAINHASTAVHCTPCRDPMRPRMQTNLSDFLDSRYSRCGNLEDLQQAIALARGALHMIDPGNGDRFQMYHALAMRLQNRYKHTATLDDLLGAIELARQASESPISSSGRSGVMNDLGNMFERLYDRTAEKRHLNQAIAWAKQAVNSTSPKGYDQFIHSTNLSNKYGKRYTDFNDSSDADEAVKYAEQALGATSEDRDCLNKARALTSLSIAVAAQASVGRTGTEAIVEGLDKAIEIAREAIQEAPEDSLDLATYLHNLANHMYKRLQVVDDSEHKDELLTLLMAAFNTPQTTPSLRIRVAPLLADVLISDNRWVEASEVSTEAIELLPLLSPRMLSLNDQQDALRMYVGFASNAAAICLKAGEHPSNAVRLLEMGRAIITGSRFADHSSLDELAIVHPELAIKFEHLRSELTPPPVKFAIYTESWESTDRRILANESLRDLLEEIHDLPGFESFSRPPGKTEQMESALSGAIVMINIAFRCDALLITSQGVTSVELPMLNEQKIKSEVENLRAERAIVPMFEWLWDDCASVILDELGYRTPFNATISTKWPRVWWILTGPLSHIPIHASGYHSAGIERTVIDRVVSSYVPSLKALVHSRGSKENTATAEDTAILVSMESTPAQDLLPYVSTEVRTVGAMLEPVMKVCEMSMPSSENVRDKLSGCKYFHFAGHGQSNRQDPSLSCLLLKDGKEDLLMVKDLFELDLHKTRPVLAYLSACSTGVNEDEYLNDEAIHIMSAFQLAGFQHVIGSLWSVSDSKSARMAQEVYKTIVQFGKAPESISLGLHQAQRFMRNNPDETVMSLQDLTRGRKSKAPLGRPVRRPPKVTDPLIWAPFIHTGT